MKNTFFLDRSGNPMIVLGLQAHNSSTGTPIIDKAIHAVQEFGLDVLEAPVYWYALEPEEGIFDLSSVRDLITRVRAAGLKLIILWFATSKNGHPNYAPDYIKLDPQKYQIAIGADGAPVASLSPHCADTLEKDARAFCKLMEFLKVFDGECGTVLAVQVENEMGLANTDRDYSAIACADYGKPLPEELLDVTLEDCGECGGNSAWRGRFGRHAHEAFSAWYHARYIGAIAERGKAVYDLPMFVNVMVGEQNMEEPGANYNAGAAVGRVLGIWKKAAPALDLLCPDIYTPVASEYVRICSRYARPDNPLFIPETAPSGDSFAMHAMIAVAAYGAIGICGFGAESALKNDGTLTEDAHKMMLSMRTVKNLEPLLIRYRGTGRVHALVQEEYASHQYLKLGKYHVVANFTNGNRSLYGLGSQINLRNPENDRILHERGRGLLVQAGEDEFFLAGAGLSVNFVRRPDPSDTNPYPHLMSRQAGQLNFLSVEEGHFENGVWVVDYLRNGDESNFGLYAHEGQAVRIRINPNMGMDSR